MYKIYLNLYSRKKSSLFSQYFKETWLKVAANISIHLATGNMKIFSKNKICSVPLNINLYYKNSVKFYEIY